MEARSLPSRRNRTGRLALSGAIVLLLGHGPAQAEPQAGLSITNEWCPVLTDEPVDPDIHTEYRGERVYLCCQKCLKQFRADPAAYVGNVPALASATVVQDPGDHETDHGEHVHAPAEDSQVSGTTVTDADSGQHDHADHGVSDASEALGLVRWLGRFHPMVVHFPIALVLMAAAAELLSMFTGASRFAFAARFCLWGGALGALIAAPLGWAGALAVEDDYVGFSARLLLIHRWVGVSTALVAGGALFACERSQRADGESWKRPYRVALMMGALLVAVAGHLGAALIYGWEYLSW